MVPNGQAPKCRGHGRSQSGRYAQILNEIGVGGATDRSIRQHMYRRVSAAPDRLGLPEPTPRRRREMMLMGGAAEHLASTMIACRCEGTPSSREKSSE